jgi:UDP-N-acetyl-D-glucosamine dehydrogenase
LRQRGAAVSYNDPYIPRYIGGRHYPGLELSSAPLNQETLQQADLVLLVTDHSEYDYPWIASQAKLILDTRNAFKGIRGDHIYQA